MALKVRRASDIVKDPRIREPWPDNWVSWTKPFHERLLDHFERLINRSRDERPLQQFLRDNPRILAIALYPHNCWIFDHPRLGGGRYIPDFLYCDRNSLGFRYILVELESPTARALNQDQSISHATHHAAEQIQDYRGWLRGNALAEQRDYPDVTDRAEALIVIGRADDGRDDDGRRRLGDLRDIDIEVSSYDRILNDARHHYKVLQAGRRSTRNLAKKLKNSLAKKKKVAASRKKK